MWLKLKLAGKRPGFEAIVENHYYVPSKKHSVMLIVLHRPPVIPYMGLVLQDLTFVHIGNSDSIKSKVNFAKRWQQYNILVSQYVHTGAAYKYAFYLFSAFKR